MYQLPLLSLLSDTAHRAIDERLSARGRSERKVPPREPKRSLGIAADGQPELRRVIGVRLGVARHQLLVACGSVGTPEPSFRRCLAPAQEAGKPGRVVGIVTGEGQSAQALYRYDHPAFGGIGLSEVAMRSKT